jgi:hypothetical protein
MTNYFKPKPHGLAREGLHFATIISTAHIGNIKTREYGTKDMQQFIFSIRQGDENGDAQTVEIHQQYHRSTYKTATLVKLLAALGISVAHVNERGIDFDSLVGRTLNVLVTHKTDAKGVTHANVHPLPLRQREREQSSTAVAQRVDEIDPACRVCDYGDCTNTVADFNSADWKGKFCRVEHAQRAGEAA